MSTHIVVDDVQARLILEAGGTIEIRDRHGKHLGYVAHGFSDEDFAIANERLHSDAPRYTTAEVMEHFTLPE
ncbi:MAG: hypothetical protein GXY83_13020 [Rhodopirellula sp.]|nr:hypothetical protein [Rhodopirellula sp.]